MKKIIVLFLFFCTSFAIGQTNLATTLRQDSIIKYEKKILAALTGTAITHDSVVVTNTVSVKVINTASVNVTNTVNTNVTNTVNTNVTNTVTVTGAVSVIQNTTAVSLTSSLVTSNGSITSGAKAISAFFSSDFSGTFNGTVFPAGAAINLCIPGTTQPAIPFTISAGSILYIKEN